METPALDAVIARLGVGPEPTNAEIAAAIKEGVDVLRGFFTNVDSIAASLIILSNRTN
jgi:hypothetical protein